MKRPKAATYMLGFALSAALTFAAYYVTLVHVDSGHEAISHSALIALVLAFAVAQLIVQAWAFLHVGNEAGPRWKLGAFIVTLGLVLIVVVASIWIMYHLNYNMTPLQVDKYMQSQQEGF